MWEKVSFYLENPSVFFSNLLSLIPGFKFFRETEYINPLTWYWQKVAGFNRFAYWPMHISSRVIDPFNVYCGIEVCPGLSPGCYIQAMNGIYFGDYVQVGPNVGIVSTNHDVYDLNQHLPAPPVIIGSYSWLGMGSVILPGVQLGEFTIVAAGAVVTKSFPEGYCVLAGNPAKVLKTLEPERCVRYQRKHKYNGYIKAEKYPAFIARKCNFTLEPFALKTVN